MTDIATIPAKSLLSSDSFLSAMSVEPRRFGARLAGPVDPPVRAAQVNADDDQNDDRKCREGEGYVLALALGREPSPLRTQRGTIEPRPRCQHRQQKSRQQN